MPLVPLCSSHLLSLLILVNLLRILHIYREEVCDLVFRLPENEVNLVIMKFLSILLIREKKEDKPNSGGSDDTKSAWYIIASIISQDNLFVNFCLKLIKQIISNFNRIKRPNVSNFNSSLLIPTATNASNRDLLPFFVKQSSREKDDVFFDYEKILIETIMRYA